MSLSLAKDIRQLNQTRDHEGTSEQYQSLQSGILGRLDLLDVPNEIYELMIARNGLYLGGIHLMTSIAITDKSRCP